MSDYFTREIKVDKRTPLRRYRRRSSRYVRRYLKVVNETRTRREPCARFGFRVGALACIWMRNLDTCTMLEIILRRCVFRLDAVAICNTSPQVAQTIVPKFRRRPPPHGTRSLSAYPPPAIFSVSNISLRYTATTRCSASSPRPPPKGTRIFISHWACRLRRRTLGVHRGPRRLGAPEKVICDPKIDARRAKVPWRVGGRWDANGRESHDRTRAGLRRGGPGVYVRPCALRGVGMSVCA